jgi:hypothetical protein
MSGSGPTPVEHRAAGQGDAPQHHHQTIAGMRHGHRPGRYSVDLGCRESAQRHSVGHSGVPAQRAPTP